MATLFLIPTTLANEITHNVLLPYQLNQIKHLKHFIVETAKVARQHLKTLNLATPLQELDIQELNKHTIDLDNLIAPLLEGFDVGIISDCGLPAIADPGHQVVRLAHQHGVWVKPLVGPSSLMLALMSSGVNGQSFAFNGYLPIEKNARIERIKLLQQNILSQGQSQIIIETPFRNQQLLEFLLQTLDNKIVLALAIDLMTSEEKIISKEIFTWKKSEFPDIHKKEVVFVVGQSSH